MSTAFNAGRRGLLQTGVAAIGAHLLGGGALLSSAGIIGADQVAITNTVVARSAQQVSALPDPPAPSGPDVIPSLPTRPQMIPLQWAPIADAFERYIMDPKGAVRLIRKNGTAYFVSAIEATEDGGMTTLAPILLGLLLRGKEVQPLLPSLSEYYSSHAGIFIDGYHGNSCEYWYLMNINSMAAGILQKTKDAVLRKQVRSSADRLLKLAHQIDYDFNQQGYKFDQQTPFTKEDRYRQPDTVGGYAYLMLMAYELFGEAAYLREAKVALQRYLSFVKNPWYEIPSAAFACLAAARLSAADLKGDSSVDTSMALAWLLDAKDGPMQAGSWGGRGVDGLMQGFHSEPPDQAYSMESMMVLPHLLPVVRYRPELANVVGRYALNVAANLRWFYPEYLPCDLQSRPELEPSAPYERLDREHKSERGTKTPYASGDYKSHRSIYGGAYSMWWAALVTPTEDSFILQLNVSSSDFLAGTAYPTFLHYNPWENARTVSLRMETGEFDVYDLLQHRTIGKRVQGRHTISLQAGTCSLIAIVPTGGKYTTEKNILSVDGVPVDYNV